LYGKGKRVFNLGKTGYKCTVCASKKPLLGTEQKDEKDKEKAKQ
jgi:hypothetical protein